MKGLIDFDIVVYVVGSACDGRHYKYKGQEFESKKLLDIQLKADGRPLDFVGVSLNPSSWDDAKSSLIKYTEDIIESSGIDDFHGFISGKSNFRYDIATIVPYKGNRDKTEKPHYYDNIRQFLVENYNAEISSGIEADDSIGLAHDPEETVICTIDKDLDCIEGLHYNWQKNSCYWVSELQSIKNFYKQVITGDSTDNIPGLYGVGKSSQLLKNIDNMATEPEVFEYVKDQYECRFGSYWKMFLLENARLLWILQKRENPIEVRLT